MRYLDLAILKREDESLDQMINLPEVINEVERSRLPSLIISLAALVAKASALQSRIAALLLSEETVSDDGDRLVTVTEAAHFLRYRVQYVYQLVREGRLRAKREGRKIRFRWGDLKAYCREGALLSKEEQSRDAMTWNADSQALKS